MKQGTTILTLDNGYHLWTNTQGKGDIQLLCLHGAPVAPTNTGKTSVKN
ncbi:proline iminopeptidase [Agrilactobacillus composti DSM 18527 = JCM 14202]|nr:proline iminopeptidase [Agrilactobacillus composti DSM 18527 = JCM 14202]